MPNKFVSDDQEAQDLLDYIELQQLQQAEELEVVEEITATGEDYEIPGTEDIDPDATK